MGDAFSKLVDAILNNFFGPSGVVILGLLLALMCAGYVIYKLVEKIIADAGSHAAIIERNTIALTEYTAALADQNVTRARFTDMIGTFKETIEREGGLAKERFEGLSRELRALPSSGRKL